MTEAEKRIVGRELKWAFLKGMTEAAALVRAFQLEDKHALANLTPVDAAKFTQASIAAALEKCVDISQQDIS